MKLWRFITIPTLILAFTPAIHAQEVVQAPADESSTKSTELRPRWATDNLFARVKAPVFDGTDSAAAPDPDPKPKPQAAADGWQFQLTPYLWLPRISGRAGIGNFDVDVDAGLSESNISLNFGFMSTFEARKDKLVILTDLQYSNLGAERVRSGPAFINADADFKTFILDPEVGYRILDNPKKGAFVDVLGGIRYWHLRSDLTFHRLILPDITRTRSRQWVDGIAGLRGRLHVTPRVFLTGKADLGGGGSDFTYQLFGGGGVTFGTRFALIGGYRYLHVNYDKDDFLFDMGLSGPIVGIGIKF
jgi:hypothetical protein